MSKVGHSKGESSVAEFTEETVGACQPPMEYGKRKWVLGNVVFLQRHSKKEVTCYQHRAI